MSHPCRHLMFVEVAYGFQLDSSRGLTHSHWGHGRHRVQQHRTVDKHELCVASEAAAAEAPPVTHAVVRHAPLHGSLKVRKCPGSEGIYCLSDAALRLREARDVGEDGLIANGRFRRTCFAGHLLGNPATLPAFAAACTPGPCAVFLPRSLRAMFNAILSVLREVYAVGAGSRRESSYPYWALASPCSAYSLRRAVNASKSTGTGWPPAPLQVGRSRSGPRRCRRARSPRRVRVRSRLPAEASHPLLRRVRSASTSRDWCECVREVWAGEMRRKRNSSLGPSGQSKLIVPPSRRSTRTLVANGGHQSASRSGSVSVDQTSSIGFVKTRSKRMRPPLWCAPGWRAGQSWGLLRGCGGSGLDGCALQVLPEMSRRVDHSARYGSSHSSRSRSGSLRRRYKRRCASDLTVTNPASRNTLRCRDTPG